MTNPTPKPARRPIRIGNASGAIGDGIDQIHRLASSGSVDAITADHLAEFNLAWKAVELQTSPDLGYEPGFLHQLAWNDGAGARAVARGNVKVVHNGGALNPKGLAIRVDEYFRSLGIKNVRVAWIQGDDITSKVKNDNHHHARLDLRHLDHKDLLYRNDASNPLLAANIYTGQRGIVKALQEGADVVICGRCCDASPVMGLASWWHGWSPTDHDALAGSLMAGHLIECGAYVTGGNFCGAAEVPKLHHVGYPIAQVAHDGTAVITKPEGTNGAVTVDTCTGQLLYEIQGHVYLNPDVKARIDGARLEQAGRDRVRLSGVVGLPPPETAKVAICLLGGYQAEISAYAAGPDIDAKFDLLRSQVTAEIDRSQFTTFSIEKYGAAAANPRSQRECTVQFRMFAQSPKKEAFEQFRRAIFYNGMQGYCGLSLHMDWRTMEPRPFVKYFPALLDQKHLPDMRVSFVSEEREFRVPQCDAMDHTPASVPIKEIEAHNQPDNPTRRYASTVERPLGDLFFARSGDKGGNANVGFWVRSEDAYQWARAFLTESKLIDLLADDWQERYAIERQEFRYIRAVHFVIKGILQEGVSSSSVLDGFGKSIGEFLRARVVEMPAELVDDEQRRRTDAMEKAAAVRARL
ncbi:hypothetical protein N3K66_007809 [Trichothecium roseum]|uniref:Uncharacterized protein n=1 Tax=Trichothecium roseum TaxID=47278 RepID=A0ACC0UTD9_9HYPO|nr:hypothetical protein N3K66_007809 [Trichothecium roseum]